jgi:PAS domain S-box-containing protein
MGTGVWSMHYIGMLAFRLPVVVQYDWPTVVLSHVAAIMASAVTMFVTSRTTMGPWRAAIGSLWMGSGIAGMHYIGMAAMRLPATRTYDPVLVSLSVLLAIVISFVALWLTFHLRTGTKDLDWRKVGSASAMGAAIPVMHYTGMAAVSFMPATMVHGDMTHAVSLSALGVIGIIGVTFMVLGLAVLTSFMDRRLSARLRDDAERREFILSAAAIGMWEQDLLTGRVTWSDTMQAVHGIPQSTPPQTLDAFIQCVHPDDRVALSRAYTECLRNGSNYTIQYRSLWPDGSAHWVDSTARVSRNAAGRPTRIVGVDRDITAQKMAETALMESEGAYRSTFEAAPAGIAHVSLEGRWLRVNRRLCDILGYTPDELLSLDLFGHLHTEERHEETLAFQRLVDGTLDRYQRERRLRRRDGSYVWTILKVTVHRDETGAAKYLIPIIDDITERKTLEATLRQAQKMDAVGQLAGGVAHDFNNLLTVIIGFSKLLLADRSVDGAVRRDLGEILNAAESAASLTRQLLAFSRRQPLELRILNLNVVISGMEQMLSRLLGEHIILTTQLAPTLGRVNADKAQIEQVVMNLAVNARDAMTAGGTLSISTSDVELDRAFAAGHPGAKPGRYVRIAVRDTGTGIDPAVKAHIFEPFYTTKTRGHGTGLGLSTVYGVVKQSNGYIDVETEVGRGSTFSIYLPRTPEAAMSDADRTDSLRPESPGTETVLLVEDQSDVRRIAREVLMRHGYAVLEACNGTEALDHAAKHDGAIQLLLTDVVMPGLDGRELARRITSRRQRIRTLFMSGYADALVGPDGALESGLALLRKPFTPADLLQKVRDVLDAATPPQA